MQKGRYFRAAKPRDLGGDMPWNLGLANRWYGNLFFDTTYIGPSIAVAYTTPGVYIPATIRLQWQADLFFGTAPVEFTLEINPWPGGEGLQVFCQLQNLLLPAVIWTSTWRWHYGSTPLGNVLSTVNLDLISHVEPPTLPGPLTPGLLPLPYSMEP